MPAPAAPSPRPTVPETPCLRCMQPGTCGCDLISAAIGMWVSARERKVLARMDELKRLAKERDDLSGFGGFQ